MGEINQIDNSVLFDKEFLFICMCVSVLELVLSMPRVLHRCACAMCTDIDCLKTRLLIRCR